MAISLNPQLQMYFSLKYNNYYNFLSQVLFVPASLHTWVRCVLRFDLTHSTIYIQWSVYCSY